MFIGGRLWTFWGGGAVPKSPPICPYAEGNGHDRYTAHSTSHDCTLFTHILIIIT